MISVRRQYTLAAFGPYSSPLYYTALSQTPRRLVVAGLSGDSLCRIVLTITGVATRDRWVLQSRSKNGVCSWPLTTLPSQAEMVCAWHIEAGTSAPAENDAPVTPLCAGSFHLLDPGCRDRLARGRKRLERMNDSQFGSTAGALFMAELGLYHEALALIDASLDQGTGPSNLLLARTVQTLIYKQMLRQIEEEHQQQKTEDARLDRYLTWTQNRERYHREITVAMMKKQCPRRCLHEVALSCK
jgi:hypothetical protein